MDIQRYINSFRKKKRTQNPQERRTHAISSLVLFLLGVAAPVIGMVIGGASIGEHPVHGSGTLVLFGGLLGFLATGVFWLLSLALGVRSIVVDKRYYALLWVAPIALAFVYLLVQRLLH
jgi:hypothetical protein